MRKLDHDLNVLYEFLEKNFTNDEYIISIFSDHGRTFLSNSRDTLSFERRRVEWLIRGRNIPSKECFEFTENIDIFDTILKKSGINNYNQDNLDGHMPNFIGGEKKKDYVITQNIYPYSSFYWFLVMGFLFYYFSLNKSVSVRILTDLLDSDQKELEYNNLLNSYLTQDSFLNRLNVLLNRNLIVHRKKEYVLTKKGKRVASIYIKIQKLFLVKDSG